MRKLVWITAAVSALACAGIAAAWDGFDSNSVKSVSATFTATNASVAKSGTCTAPDGTYAITRATYTGTATSTDPTLNGPITLDTESLVNTTTGFGTLSGKFEVGTDPNDTDAHFEAVVSGTNIVGFAEGHTQDEHTRLLANLSATYSSTGGLTGFIGSGASGGNAVEVGPGGCQPTPAPKPDMIKAEGTVTAISSTSITAATVTCAIPSTLTAQVAALNLLATTGTTSGSQVEMLCMPAGGTNTLVRISVGGHHGDDDSHDGN